MTGYYGPGRAGVRERVDGERAATRREVSRARGRAAKRRAWRVG